MQAENALLKHNKQVIMIFVKNLSLSFFLIFLISCARSPIKTAEEAIINKADKIKIEDQADSSSLLKAIESCLIRLQQRNKTEILQYGKQKISVEQQIEEYLILANKILNNENYISYLQENYQALPVYGKESISTAHATGYYVPFFEARSKADKEFSHPVFSKPNDVVVLNLAEIYERYPKLQKLFKEKPDTNINLRLENKNLKAYYTRTEIDQSPSPYPKNQILAYMRAFDLFEMQIQGSGVVQLEDSQKLYLGYDFQNGHEYIPVGKELLKIYEPKDINMQSIRAYYNQLEDSEKQKFLNLNPSYVYFKKL